MSTAVYGAPGGTAEQAEWRRLYMSGDQTPIVVTDVINLVDSGEGTGVAFNNTTHRATLAARKSFELQAALHLDGSAATSELWYQWWDVTNNVGLGNYGGVFAITHATNGNAQIAANAAVTPSIDIEVELRAMVVNGAPVGIWTTGCYGFIKQISKQVFTGSLTGDIAINDQAASGYFDIGTMRIQWGTEAVTSDSPWTATLPVPFADTNYIIAFSFDDSWTSSGAVQGPLRIESGSKTTTQFEIDRDDDVTGTINVDWIAIGLKP